MKSKREKQIARKLLDLTKFDVSRYDTCADFTANQWLALLSFRASHKELELGVDKAAVAVDKDCYDRGLRVLLQLMQNPVPPDSPRWGAVKFQSVYDAEIYAIWSGHQAIERFLPEATEACQQEESRDADVNSEAPPLAYASLYDHMLECSHQADHCRIWIQDDPLVGINLSAPDDVIKLQFAEWLKAKREKVANRIGRAPPPKFTDADFRQWHKHRVLAFLDLEMFAFHLGLALTDEMIGQKLFPNEFDVGIGERIRKTVRPLAKWLTSTQTLDALTWQAGVDYWRARKQNAQEID